MQITNHAQHEVWQTCERSTLPICKVCRGSTRTNWNWKSPLHRCSVVKTPPSDKLSNI